MGKRNGSYAPLWSLANQVMGEIDAWLAANDHKRIRLRFRPNDQARLLRLRAWAVMYATSVPEILSLILPILRAQATAYRNSQKKRLQGYGLGISVSALTSTRAEEMLKQELRKKYPDGENRNMLMERERDRELEAERAEELDGLQPRERQLSLLDADSPEQFAAQYVSLIEQRRRDRAQRLKRDRSKMAYRGNLSASNPWR